MNFPEKVHPARVLSHLYTFLGRSEKLGLSGRHSRDVGILTTSKLYKVQGKVFAFTPQRFDFERNYMDCDPNLMMTTLEYGLYYLSKSWSTNGRPTISLVMGHNMLENGRMPPAMLSALKKLRAGYINGTRVVMGQYEQFLKTTCITDLSFLAAFEEGNSELLQPEVQRYLAQQLGRPMSAILSLLSESQILSSTSTTSHLLHSRRKSSIRGTIRKSRSKIDVMSSSNDMPSGSRLPRKSSELDHHRSAHPSGSGVTAGSVEEEEDEIMSIFVSSQEEREKVLSQSQYGQHEVAALVTMLIQAPSIEEQADILHYLVLCYGPRHKLYVNQLNKEIEIRDLMSTLYETALVKKNWAIVRQAAGFLGKRVEDLSKAVTDLLVRQKQVTVGLPGNELIVSLDRAALKSRDLILIIYNAYRGDESMTMLTQELLVYLSMFIQTEPELFHGMMRLRIGLIIQVMVSEVERCLKLQDNDEATDELMSLSPYEMRNLLHHIMSGREFGINKCGQHQSGYNVVSDTDRVDQVSTKRQTTFVLNDKLPL